MKVVCTFGLFLGGRWTERHTDQSCGNVNVSMRATTGAKTKVFVKKGKNSDGHLKSHMASCSPK